MKPNSSITTKISLHTSPNASELTFLIIKKPEYKLKDNNLNKAAILEDILSMRYSMHPLQKENEKNKTLPYKSRCYFKRWSLRTSICYEP